MKEIVDVDWAALIVHLRNTHPDFAPRFDPQKITLQPYFGNDGWKNVHLIMLEGWGVIGFCERNC